MSETALHSAVRLGELNIVKELVKSGADLGARGINGVTALMCAAINDRRVISEVLVKRMTSRDLRVEDIREQRNGLGRRPIDRAKSKSQGVYDILELLERQLYTSGLAGNFEKPCNVTITVVGHHGVGKSCFVRQLKQENIPEGGPGSTDTADFFVNYLGFNPDTGLIQLIDEDGELETGRQRLKKLINRNQAEKTAAAAAAEQSANQPDNKEETSKRVHDTDKEKAFDSRTYQRKPSPPTPRQNRSLLSGIRQKLKQFSTLIFRRAAKGTLSEAELTQEQRDVLEEVMGAETKEVKGYITIYDFGGEKVFYNTHHCFMSSNMVFVLVFDVAMCLDPSRAKDGYERIEFWLRNIATYAIDRAAHDKGTPPVILVGSHLDLVSEEKDEQERVFASVLEKLCDKPELREIMETHVQEMFPVAYLNDSTKNLDTYLLVWNTIIEIAPLQSQWMKPVPARWVALEYELVRLKNEGLIILTFADLLEINRKLAVPIAEDELLKFLMKLRFAGSFLCFDIHSKNPFIVLQPQWIIDAFKAIITDQKFAVNFSTKQRLTWTKYEKSGIISHDFIRQLWGRSVEHGFLEEEARLFIIMETLGLLTKPISVETEVDYFIAPSILKPADPEIIRPVLADPDTVTTVTLCVKFDNPFIPQAVWDKMIASCIHRFQRLKVLGHDGLAFIRRGFACLAADFLWNMIINCSDNAMKVTMFKTASDHSIPTGTGINLLNILEFLLQRILELNHQSHLSYQFYLHNDFRFTADEQMVKVDDLHETARLRCYSLNWCEWIDQNDLYIWFKNPNKKKTRAREQHVGSAQKLPDRKLSYKEVGRVSRYIGSTYQTFFAELDCPIALVEQEMEEHGHLTFRSRITKIFIHLLKTKVDIGFVVLADAMSRHGIDPAVLIDILDSSRNIMLHDETLSGRWLKTKLSVSDVPSIAECVEVKSYFNFFMELGLSPETIDEFDDQYRNKRTREKITALLKACIKETKPRPTVNALLLAMQECDMDTEPLFRLLRPS